jgi:tetratricopeptide (TPR) repeat protein
MTDRAKRPIIGTAGIVASFVFAFALFVVMTCSLFADKPLQITTTLAAGAATFVLIGIAGGLVNVVAERGGEISTPFGSFKLPARPPGEDATPSEPMPAAPAEPELTEREELERSVLGTASLSGEASLEASAEVQTERDPLSEAFDAYYDAKDYALFDAKMREAANTATNEGVRVAREAFRLGLLCNAGQVDKLDELKALSEREKHSPQPPFWLGECYRTAGNHVEAAAWYAQAYKRAQNLDLRMGALRRRVEALRKAQHTDAAHSDLNQALDAATTDAERAQIHKVIAEFHADCGDAERRRWHLEKALELSPADLDSRFKLAYSYEEDGFALAAAYHYQILLNQRGDPWEYNNLAIILQRLDMPVTATRYYRAAIKQKNTKAAANLAEAFADHGFIEEATEVLDRALKQESVDPRVHTIYSSLAAREKKEERRLEKLRDAGSTERQLLLKKVDLEHRLPPLSPADVEGTWDTPIGQMTVAVEEDKLTAKLKDDWHWWRLTGQLTARSYAFEWTNDHYHESRAGDGLLLFQANDHCEGIIRHTPTKGEVKTLTGKRRPRPLLQPDSAPLLPSTSPPPILS